MIVNNEENSKKENIDVAERQKKKQELNYITNDKIVEIVKDREDNKLL